jgi:hypothetical protein
MFAETSIEFIVLIIAVVIVGMVVSQMMAAKRRKELAAWAASHGWSFNEGRDPTYYQKYYAFDALKQGNEQYAFNIVSGATKNHRIEAFDYHYETYSHSKNGQQTHHHYFSAVLILSPVRLEPLFIRPERLLDKIGEFVGFDDIDFESAEFSRKFYVKAPNKKWAYDVLHPRAMEFLLAQPKSFTMQFAGHAVMVWQGDKRLTPADFDAAIAAASGLLDQLPGYVIEQQTSA